MLKSGAAVSHGARTLGFMPKSGVGVGLGARTLGFYCRGLLKCILALRAIRVGHYPDSGRLTRNS